MTNDYYYYYACFFEKPFLLGWPFESLQYTRMGLGLLLACMIALELFTSDSDIVHPLSNFNIWALCFSFASILY